MLPVDQLVPPPIVREQQKVVVGELQPRIGRVWRIHVIAPGHALIVDRRKSKDIAMCPRGFTQSETPRVA